MDSPYAVPAPESAKPPPPLPQLRLVLSVAPQGSWPDLEEQEPRVRGRPQAPVSSSLGQGTPPWS